MFIQQNKRIVAFPERRRVRITLKACRTIPTGFAFYVVDCTQTKAAELVVPAFWIGSNTIVQSIGRCTKAEREWSCSIILPLT